jgi:hypothetical protein
MLIEVKTPFIGLRSYDASEVDIFFGRETQIDQLLDRLNEQHFLAVVGPSGCGKSSLVRAGLIGALISGLLPDRGPRWRIAELRPGNAPFRTLAESLLKSSFFPPVYEDHDKQLAFLESTIRTGPKSIINLYEQSDVDPFANLIIVVDQFEEIFRFRKEQNMDEAEAFVSLLLDTSAKIEHPIFVVMTMRSEYLGHCSLFSGLPEKLNGTQFLTPRLTREQCREAIEKPLILSGGSIDPALSNQLLNDFGSDPDQLPLLQHTLMRMWDKKKNSAEKRIDLDTYKDVGGISDCLSIHATETYNSLSDTDKEIIESVFRCLTDNITQEFPTRRPLKIERISEITGYAIKEIIDAVEPFRQDARNFLSPPGKDVTKETTIDITHESIMRQWQLLKEWMKKENRKARIFRWLADAVQNKRALLKGIDLSTAKNWLRDDQLNQHWAHLYVSREKENVSLADVKTYIDRSYGRRTRTIALYAIPVIFIIIMLILFSTLLNTSKYYQVLYEKEYGSALDQIQLKYGPIAAYNSLTAFRSSVHKSLTPGNIPVPITGRDFLFELDQRLKNILASDSVYGTFPALKDRPDRFVVQKIENDTLYITDNEKNIEIKKPLPATLITGLVPPMIYFSYDFKVIYFTFYNHNSNLKSQYERNCFFGMINSAPFHQYTPSDYDLVGEVNLTEDNHYRLFLNNGHSFVFFRFSQESHTYKPTIIDYDPVKGKGKVQKFDLSISANQRCQLLPGIGSDSNWYFYDKRSTAIKRINGLSKKNKITQIIQNENDTILIDRDSTIIFRSRTTHSMRVNTVHGVKKLMNFILKDSLLFMTCQTEKGLENATENETLQGLLVFNIQNETIKGFPLASRTGFDIDDVKSGFVLIYNKESESKCLIVLEKITDLNSIPPEFKYSPTDLKEMRIQSLAQD